MLGSMCSWEVQDIVMQKNGIQTDNPIVGKKYWIRQIKPPPTRALRHKPTVPVPFHSAKTVSIESRIYWLTATAN